MDKDYEEYVKIITIKPNLTELKSLLDNINPLSNSTRDLFNKLEVLLDNFEKLYNEYYKQINSFRKAVYKFKYKSNISIVSRNSATSEIEKIKPKPNFLEDILKKINDVILPEEESSCQTNDNDNNDDNDDEKSKLFLFMLAKGLKTFRKYYSEGAAQYHKEFEVY